MKLHKILFTSIMMGSSLISQAVVEFKWGIDNQLYHQIRIAREFKESIENKTAGRISIKIIPYDIHKKVKASAQYLKDGDYQIHQTFVEEYARKVPEMRVFQIPYLFNSNEHIEKYLTSERGQSLLKKISNSQFLAVNYSFAGGFLNFYSHKKMNSFSDLKGDHCYNVESYGFAEYFLKDKGIKTSNNVDSLEYTCGELLSSEANLVFDLEKNPLDTWLNITNHRVVSRATIVNRKELNSLTEKDKNLFIAELAQHLEKERHYVYEASELSLKLFKNKGGLVNKWTKEQKQREKSFVPEFMPEIYVPLKELISYIEKLDAKPVVISSK